MMESKGGLLLKRKDFLGVDEEAGSHPNRTYYFKKNSDDLNKRDPHNKESLLLRGSTLLKMERLEEAVADFSSVLRMDGSAAAVEIYYKRGVALARLDQQEAAIADFSRVLSFNPDHVNAAFARAACYNTIGQFSRAIEDYNTALLKDQSAATSSRSTAPSPSPRVRKSVADRDRDRDRGMVPVLLPRSAAEVAPPLHTSADSPSASSSSRSGRKQSWGTPRTGGEPSQHPPMHSPPSRAAAAAVAGRGGLQRQGQVEDLHVGMGHFPVSTPPSGGRWRQDSEDDNDNSTVMSGITFMSRGYLDSPGAAGGGGGGGAHLPLSSDEYHQKGYELRRQGKFESAIEEYSRAIQKDPRHFKALFNRAFALDKLGEHRDAISDYSRALEVDPGNAFAYYNRGISHDRQKNYQQASADFQRASELSPNNLDFLHNLALCQRKMGHAREALDTYSQCLRLDPSHVKARHGRAMCSESLQLLEQALQDYDVILAQSPHHLLCLVSRAHLLHRMGCQAADAQDSDQSSSRVQAAGASPADYSEEALKSFSQSLDILCPDVQTLINSISDQSSALSATGSGSVSSQATGSINRCTESISILFARARILEDRGDNSGAIEDLTSAIRLASALVQGSGSGSGFVLPPSSTSGGAADPREDPPCLSLYLLFYNRALGWKARDQYDNAMTDLTTTLQLLSDERHALQSRRDAKSLARVETLISATSNAYNHRGFCFRKLENYDGAIADYTNAIRVTPDNARALNNRAYCHAKKEQFAAAVEDYSRVIDMDPHNSHSYHNRGISLDKLGRAAEALADFAKVIELDSSSKHPHGASSSSSSGGGSEQIDLSSSFRERYAHADSTPALSTYQLHHQSQHQQSHQQHHTSSPGRRSSTGKVLSSNSGASDTPQRQDPRSIASGGPASISSVDLVPNSTLTRKPRRPPPSRPTNPPSPGPQLARSERQQQEQQQQQQQQRPYSPSYSSETDSRPLSHPAPPAPRVFSPQRRALADRNGDVDVRLNSTRPQPTTPSASPLDKLAQSFGRKALEERRSTAGGRGGAVAPASRDVRGGLRGSQSSPGGQAEASNGSNIDKHAHSSFEPIRLSARASTPKKNHRIPLSSPQTTSVADEQRTRYQIQNSYNSRSFRENNDGGF